MGRKLTTTLAALLFAFSLTAGPAIAQEGFSAEECLAAIVAGANISDAELDEILDELDTFLEQEPNPSTESLETFLSGQLGRPVDLPDDLGEVCTIYIVDVLVDDGDGDGGDGDGDGGDGAVDGGQRTPPGQVLGSGTSRRLPMTGSDILWLAVIGSVILGLGILAVRAPRDQAT
jgi:LPXTG-motif cell wall-anchored protein